MAWAVPEYSRTKVEQAGRCFVDPDASYSDRAVARAIINNWRSAHSFPLNTFQATLRDRARQIDADALIAQRIKRLPSIESKLRRFSGMGLPRMQDIGGCRAVLGSKEVVDELGSMYVTGRFQHERVRHDDYMENPKASGYRGVHLAYRYLGRQTTDWNGLRIEIQLRSKMQHAWATAVETVGTFIQQALKSSQGEDEWLRFFALMGSEIALVENSPTVPGTPTGRSEIRSELRDCATKLDVVARLEAYGHALQTIQDEERNEHYFVLELDAAEKKLTIRGYRRNELPQASEQYQTLEQAVSETPGRDVVLVSAESLTALQRAYPNYFLDTTEFLTIVREATS